MFLFLKGFSCSIDNLNRISSLQPEETIVILIFPNNFNISLYIHRLLNMSSQLINANYCLYIFSADGSQQLIQIFYLKPIFMKLKALCFLALILALGSSLPTADGVDTPLPEVQQLTVGNVYPFIDYQLKQTWWQYLRRAKLLYRANVDQQDSFLFLSIYRNIVGTFLTITTWTKGETRVKVNTLVRLGDGYADGSQANYSPIQIKPVSFKLGEGQYFVDSSQKGQLQVNGQVVGDQTNGNGNLSTNDDDTATKIAARCAFLDSWIREHNWQYLRGAVNIHRSGRLTEQRYYCVYNYVNIVGTFFVLASEQISTGQHNIGTFVRLGDGHETDSQALYSPVGFAPVILDFDLLKK